MQKGIFKIKVFDLHIHDLRRTYATRLLNAGIDIYTIQKLLNHTDIQTTMRYLSYSVDKGQQAVNALDKLNVMTG